MELIRKQDIETLSNSAVRSRQLIFPENSRSRRITVTRVTLPPGIKNPPHRHATSEQVWVALHGSGTLLLDNEQSAAVAVGDVVGRLGNLAVVQPSSVHRLIQFRHAFHHLEDIVASL